MVLNCQNDVALSLPALRSFVRRLRASLNLDGRDFNVCFTSDREIARLNAAYRGKPRPTDVLSFPFEEKGKSVKRAHVRKHAPAFGGRDTGPGLPVGKAERGRAFAPQGPDAVFSGFLGDIVISAGAARRNARAERQSTANEIRRLVLHGVLHLLGYDHEKDRGEMTTLELSLREHFGIAGEKAGRQERIKGQKGKVKSPK
ncbi:MAG: rRNA maturation RNase YbeY [Acidobacteria bacterium]|nr:MAG: rRNA maturation RNase YbeY [Acidobacteriota bacterium]